MLTWNYFCMYYVFCSGRFTSHFKLCNIMSLLSQNWLTRNQYRTQSIECINLQGSLSLLIHWRAGKLQRGIQIFTQAGAIHAEALGPLAASNMPFIGVCVFLCERLRRRRESHANQSTRARSSMQTVARQCKNGPSPRAAGG
jgi:hypothetical protein